MNYITLLNPQTISYHLCGKFQSLNENWIHLTRELTDFELFLVTSGTLYIADDKNSYEIHAGEYLIMTPTINQHGFQNSNCSFYWMHFSCDSYQITKEEPSDGSFYVLPQQGSLFAMDRVILLLTQLMDAEQRYHFALVNNPISAAVLGELTCQSDWYRHHKKTQEFSQLYQSICDYIQCHIHENLTVQMIAEYFGYHPKYLSAQFHKQNNITIKQYLLQSKMDCAKALLVDSTQTIADIAYGLNFSDPHNFSKAFKKIVGISPKEYRLQFNKHS